ncbi:hypothetical protein ACFVHQ_02100 [Actinomycetes bacterium NPDC127524]
MNVYKVSIKNTDILFQKGTIRVVNCENFSLLEVELSVHPTVLNYINTLNLYKERVNILVKDDVWLTGEFEIHTGKSNILLVGKSKEIAGAEELVIPSYEKSLFLTHEGEGIALDNELKTKQTTLPIYILQSLLDHEIEDEGNRDFVQLLLNKLKNREKLNSFEQYVIDEVGYFVESALNKVR